MSAEGVERMPIGEMADKLMRNARVLGKLSNKADKLRTRPHAMSEWDERDALRYFEILGEQEMIVERMRSGRRK